MTNQPQANDHIQKAAIACTFLFLLLCIFHFFSQRPLWLDEGFVLTNMQKLSYGEIFGPLKYNNQAFPRVHLVLIKFLSVPFEYHVLTLRLVSFLSMVAAFFVWKAVYQKIFGVTWWFILALVSFAGSYYLSYYAAELKPYAMDVLVAGLFCWFVLKQGEDKQKDAFIHSYWVLALFVCTLFFSYASIFFVWIIGYNFIVLLRDKHDVKIPVIVYSLLTVIALGVLYQIDLRHSTGNNALNNYWASYFICTESFGCGMESFWEGSRRLATRWFGKGKVFMKWASFVIPLFLYALVQHGFRPLIKERLRIFSIGALSAVLFSELFVLGLFKKYPFTGDRITLFFAPFVFVLIIRALMDLKRWKPLYYFFLGNYLILLVASSGYTVYLYGQLYWK